MDDRVLDQSDETDEWLDALDSVAAFEGIGKVDEILDSVVAAARRKGARLPFAANTAYVNTIPPAEQPPHPGNRKIEQIIRRYVRWNAAAIVVKANKEFFGARRPYCELPVGGDAVRHRIHAFLACLQRDPWRRPGLFPGPQLARNLRSSIHGGPSQ